MYFVLLKAYFILLKVYYVLLKLYFVLLKVYFVLLKLYFVLLKLYFVLFMLAKSFYLTGKKIGKKISAKRRTFAFKSLFYYSPKLKKGKQLLLLNHFTIIIHLFVNK